MRAWTGTALGAALALGACGGAGEAEEAAEERPRQIRVVSDEQRALMEADEVQRNLGLMRAVRYSGERCGKVNASAYQQMYEDLPMWVVSCDEDRQWAVFIGGDGSVQVRDCASAERLGLPRCTALEQAGEAGRG